MTDEMAAFAALLEAGDGEIAERFPCALEAGPACHGQMVHWCRSPIAEPAQAVATAERLTGHALFDWTNPNRFRSVIGGLTAGNPAGFHDPSGAGYRFLADWTDCGWMRGTRRPRPGCRRPNETLAALTMPIASR